MAIIREKLQLNHRFLSIVLLLFILAIDTGFSSFDSEMSVGRSSSSPSKGATTTTSIIGRRRQQQGFPKDIIISRSSEEDSDDADNDTEDGDNDDHVSLSTHGMTPYKRYLEKGRLWLRSRRQEWPINTVKRGPSCMMKCLQQGYLHPAQCHSLC